MNKDLILQLVEKSITSFSMDTVPRTTRAQAMDILSSMATVSGYRAVLDAALHLPKFFPMFMTAAGTIKPAKVLILGAGVAGLQAVATSRKLGSVVEVFDVRAAVKEEVQSLGGKFIEVEGAKDDKTAGGYAVEQSEEFKQKQRQLIHDHAVKANVVIATAQIPGRQAPILLTTETVNAMMPGSVVIDLAASTGGNCEVTQNGKTIVHNQVTIIGKSDYPSDMPFDASKMFGNNLLNFLKLIISKEGNLNLNFEDDIVKGTCITHNKEIVNERVKQTINA
jgi:NAD(P) transhydrogenase subunit alpha